MVEIDKWDNDRFSGRCPTCGQSFLREAADLLSQLDYHITTTHLDMGGDNRYTLRMGAHPIITKIKVLLSKEGDDD